MANNLKMATHMAGEVSFEARVFRREALTLR